ncbi:hypothetical protein DS2_15764 [Catenovulum agarivorans DS-2]|uniref:Uncharacterized protein n=1 Tax=Catenovulum agarivorans DS-2 TaxID=1328313 RepID=W7QIN0_9ALTE|nr:hypothetical protein [Catenovulum agarivorans]EWH08782.1 hypothetical protein DS2_15764 [Catenovulum agarivorans DS-2]
MFFRYFFIAILFVAQLGCKGNDSQPSAEQNITLAQANFQPAARVNTEQVNQFNQAVNSALLQSFSNNNSTETNVHYAAWGRLKQLHFLSVAAQPKDVYWQVPLLADVELADYAPYLMGYFEQFEQSAYLNNKQSHWLVLQANYPYKFSFQQDLYNYLGDSEVIDFYADTENALKLKNAKLAELSHFYQPSLTTSADTRLYWLDSLELSFSLTDNFSVRPLKDRIFKNSARDYWRISTLDIGGDMQLFEQDDVKIVNLLPSNSEWKILVVQTSPYKFASVRNNLAQWLADFNQNNSLQSTSIEIPHTNFSSDYWSNLNFAMESSILDEEEGFGDDNRITSENLTYADFAGEQAVSIKQDKLTYSFVLETSLTELKNIDYFYSNGSNSSSVAISAIGGCSGPSSYEVDITSTLFVLIKDDAVLSLSQFDVSNGDPLPICFGGFSPAFEPPGEIIFPEIISPKSDY